MDTKRGKQIMVKEIRRNKITDDDVAGWVPNDTI